MASPNAFYILLAISGVAAFVVGALLIPKLSRAPITTRPLMNKSEQRLFPLLQRVAAEVLPSNHLVMSQVSYGEFLRCKDRKTFWSFNAKRADFLIVDSDTNPVAVVEYQGSGHWGSSAKSRENAEKRDRTKRGVLSRAGIPMIEVPAKFTAQSVRQLMETALPQGTKVEPDAKSR